MELRVIDDISWAAFSGALVERRIAAWPSVSLGADRLAASNEAASRSYLLVG
jgi:hypothetical protein